MKFNPNDNVIIILLDAISADLLADIMKDNASIFKEYDGFVNFTNNVGMYACTDMTIPALMTGRYYESDPNELFAALHDSDDSLIKYFINNGYDVIFRTRLSQLSYSSVQALNVNTQPLDNLNATVSPDVNQYYYDNLATIPIDNDKPVFTLQHFTGGHRPFIFDENCAQEGNIDIYTQSVCVFKKIDKLFGIWKERGIYNSGTIVVAADHGGDYDAYDSGIGQTAFPVLMIKPKYSHGEMVNSDIPTSSSKLAPLLKQITSADNPPGLPEIEKFMYTEKRRFEIYEVLPDGSYSYYIDADNRSALELKPVSMNYVYNNMRRLRDSIYPDMILNGAYIVQRGILVDNATITMRVPEKTGSAAIHLWMYEGFESTDDIINFSGRLKDFVRYTTNVSPDVNGIFNIKIKGKGQISSLTVVDKPLFEVLFPLKYGTYILERHFPSFRTGLESRNNELTLSPANDVMLQFRVNDKKQMPVQLIIKAYSSCSGVMKINVNGVDYDFKVQERQPFKMIFQDVVPDKNGLITMEFDNSNLNPGQGVSLQSLVISDKPESAGLIPMKFNKNFLINQLDKNIIYYELVKGGENEEGLFALPGIFSSLQFRVGKIVPLTVSVSGYASFTGNITVTANGNVYTNTFDAPEGIDIVFNHVLPDSDGVVTIEFDTTKITGNWLFLQTLKVAP
ncbi:MAG: LTA synthase family protein [Deferribacteraceae bacterium]|nr:LTA synthase family protein [Deferribacteraceae bacterium]